MATGDPQRPTAGVQTSQPVVIQSPQQPVIVPPPGTPIVAPVAAAAPASTAEVRPLRLYSHSTLFYWWPVWLVGFILAFITYSEGELINVGPDNPVKVHASSNLGVFFFLTLFLIIVITNASARGLISGIIIMAAVLVTVLLAYFRLWDPVLGWFADLRIYVNLGAYFWFSTLMFLTWFLTVFVFDRMSYWEIKPGQITHTFVLGSSARSYDTQNMVMEKFRSDLFRNWILGLGSGDLRVHTYGGAHEEIWIPNVLFIGSKVHQIETLIATRPSDFNGVAIK